VTFHTPEVANVGLGIRAGAREVRVLATPLGDELSVTMRGEYAVVSVPRLKFMESVCVPRYFR